MGCGKRKAARPLPARDLYTGTLFKLARRYAERKCDLWFVLSAKHGVVAPTRVIAPYETSMASLTKEERKAWGERASEVLKSYPDAVFVFLAGNDYALAIEGLRANRPLDGLGIGRRMAWLKKELQKR